MIAKHIQNDSGENAVRKVNSLMQETRVSGLLQLTRPYGEARLDRHLKAAT